MSGGSRPMLPYRLRRALVHWVIVTPDTSSLGRPPRGSPLSGLALSPARQLGGASRCAVALLVAIAATNGCGVLDTARRPFASAPGDHATPWRPSESQREARALLPRVPPPIDLDTDKVHGLAELIDLAQRMNPQTRRAWEEARAAAARHGQAAAAYFPVLAVAARGGQSKIVDRGSDGSFTVEGASLVPFVRLGWLLLDFGRRDAQLEQSAQEALGANWSFNRRHQEITVLVARSFFGLAASREQVTAARAALDSATAVERAVSARLDQGFATRPELLLATQEKARAAFELQKALGAVDDARATLAESLGIAPTVPLRVVELSALPLPSGLTDSVEAVIDRALTQRPDLGARLADLRAREAAQKRARADFWPTLSFSGSAGQQIARYQVSGTSRTFSENEFAYGAFLTVDWTLFDGFARENTLREASARRGIAATDLEATELRAIREVWKAYADVKTALAKYEFAQALLAASEKAYASTLESYRQAGLATVLDLLAAQRDLASARSIEVASRADLLTASANLAFAAGD